MLSGRRLPNQCAGPDKLVKASTPASSLAGCSRAFTGFCLACRLFSSAVYNDAFAEHTPPEIMNTALEGVVLVMKAMGIEKVVAKP